MQRGGDTADEFVVSLFLSLSTCPLHWHCELKAMLCVYVCEALRVPASKI